MTIAGGIMGALYHRERTGEATSSTCRPRCRDVVDGPAIALSLVLGIPWTAPSADRMGANPLTRTYVTGDGRSIASPAYRPAGTGRACARPSAPELATDPRFGDHASIIKNGGEAAAVLSEAFASATLEEWHARLVDFDGQWAAVQDTLEVGRRPADGGQRVPRRTATPLPVFPSNWSRHRSSSTSSRRSLVGRPISTSTEMPFLPGWGSTGTPSWTSRSAGSWHDHHPTLQERMT